MQSRIREVRKAKGMTLADVAAACQPPTTAQTVGRLETGTRTLSLDWVNRIADALGVDSAELVRHGEDRPTLEVAAILDGNGHAQAPRQKAIALPPMPGEGLSGVKVAASIGDYRAGDTVWCRHVQPAEFDRALNRDVLVPRPAGRYIYGRLIHREGGQLLVLPPGPGARQQVVKDPAWLAVAETLVREL